MSALYTAVIAALNEVTLSPQIHARVVTASLEAKGVCIPKLVGHTPRPSTPKIIQFQVVSHTNSTLVLLDNGQMWEQDSAGDWKRQWLPPACLEGAK